MPSSRRRQYVEHWRAEGRVTATDDELLAMDPQSVEARILANAGHHVRPQNPDKGPGTELRKLLRIKAKCAGCGALGNRMNILGPAWCRANEDWIVDEVCRNAAKVGRLAQLAARPPLVRERLRKAIGLAERQRRRDDFQNGYWAVGITTAPRGEEYLPFTIQSLRDEGWHPWVWAEPDSKLRNTQGLRVVHNDNRLGAWNNWRSMVRAILDETNARVIMTVQDDTILTPGTRPWVESRLWPQNCGLLNLYAAPKYQYANWKRRKKEHLRFRPRGLNRIRTASLWGACAMVFPRDVLEELLDHPKAVKWKGMTPRRKTKNGTLTAEQYRARLEKFRQRQPTDPDVQNVDTIVGYMMDALGRAIWIPVPSLAYHAGEKSSIGHDRGRPMRVAREQYAGQYNSLEEAFDGTD